MNASSQTSVTANETGFLSGFLRYLPLVQWILMLCIAVGMYYLTMRDSQTAQASAVSENARKITALEKTVETNKTDGDGKVEDLRKTVLTKDVFDVYHKADSERFERMEKGIDKILENQSRLYK